MERSLQKEYWKEHTVELSVEAMMLDSRASKLDQEERPEILASLPSIEGKAIVELGAGIGRFTGEFAKHANWVLACDFMDHVVKKNEEINGHYRNVTFICADVASEDLHIAPASTDVVFSNWLLMYLSDEEVEDLAARMIHWVKAGGYIFFRESCFHQSGDHKRKTNPTHYRQPSFYTKIFAECFAQEEDGSYSGLELVSCKCVGAYVRNKRNQNQVCWLWQKVRSCNDEKTSQRFLDTVQYSFNGILCYERVFGEGFVSTGGKDTTEEFVKILGLQSGMKVLDIGCGIGGGDFFMAETYDVDVVAIDLSINMISIALERAIGRKCSVQFELADCTKKEFPKESFDVIYSRDAILHIQDKPGLFQRMYDWLKPGGKVLISDYCKAPDSPSPEFLAYIKQRGYDLHDVVYYGQMLRDAGLSEVISEDRTDQFVRVLQNELAAIEQSRDSFIQDFSEDNYKSIVDGWKAKLKRCYKGEQKWGLFFASKKYGI